MKLDVELAFLLETFKQEKWWHYLFLGWIIVCFLIYQNFPDEIETLEDWLWSMRNPE